MVGRGRGTIRIRREELVGVLDSVVGGRMRSMVRAVVLPPLQILLRIVGLAVHRKTRRGRWEGGERPSRRTRQVWRARRPLSRRGVA